MNARIRAARRRDLPAVYDVLRASFTDVPIDVFVAQTERDPALRMSHVRVAVVGGRIASHVRIFARTMLVRGVPVRAAGIGSVATHPDFQGRGLASDLVADAIRVAHEQGFVIAFLFTGIPGFYERLGFRLVSQPLFTVASREAARLPSDPRYRIRRLRAGDVPATLRIYDGATAGSTGPVARTERSWRAAQTWLAEDPAGCFVACTMAGEPVAYIRARVLVNFAYQVLEAEHLPGHEGAISTLLAASASRGQAVYPDLVAAPAPQHALAGLLRALPSCQETADVRYPMMMHILSLRGLMDRLSPRLRTGTRRLGGVPLHLRAERETYRLALPVRAGAGRGTRYGLDADSTMTALIGQRRASEMVQPSPPAEIAEAIDGLLPETPLAFRMSDRI